MTRRILHIVPSLDHGGTAKQLALLVSGLPKNEFEVHVAAVDSGGAMACELQRYGIEPVVIGRRWKIDPFTLRRLRRHIRRLRPHLVHTWMFDANTYGRIAARGAGVRRLVAAERQIDVWKTDWELAIDRRLARKTDRIVVNSTAVRDFYIARGLPSEKFIVIPGGTQPAQPSSFPRAMILNELGLPPDAKLLAYLGSLQRRKRIKELIWATDQLRAVATTAHLLIVGHGPMRGPLERYRGLNRIDDRVHFLGSRDDMPRLLPHVDVLWQAGAYEGQSNAVLEAMAAGVPVVAADSPGNRELVVDAVTGYLVPLDQRAGFARCTLPLIENAELARSLGEAGRRRMLEYFEADRMVAAYAELYRELLDN